MCHIQVCRPPSICYRANPSSGCLSVRPLLGLHCHIRCTLGLVLSVEGRPFGSPLDLPRWPMVQRPPGFAKNLTQVFESIESAMADGWPLLIQKGSFPAGRGRLWERVGAGECYPWPPARLGESFYPSRLFILLLYTKTP